MHGPATEWRNAVHAYVQENRVLNFLPKKSVWRLNGGKLSLFLVWTMLSFMEATHRPRWMAVVKAVKHSEPIHRKNRKLFHAG
jgi:hypothetical protein